MKCGGNTLCIVGVPTFTLIQAAGTRVFLLAGIAG